MKYPIIIEVPEGYWTSTINVVNEEGDLINNDGNPNKYWHNSEDN